MDNNNFDNKDNMNVIDFNNYPNQNINQYSGQAQNTNYEQQNMNQYNNQFQNINYEQPQNINQYNGQIQNTNYGQSLNTVNEMSSEQVNNMSKIEPNYEQQNIQQDEKIDVNIEEPKIEETPKYGYISNEKPNLDRDENANIKFIILLAILMLGVIILLPFISNLI